MTVRVVANPQWLSLARAVLSRHDLLRPALSQHRHNFTKSPQLAQVTQKDQTTFFTPPQNSLSILEHSLSEYKQVATEFEDVTAENANERLQKLVQDHDWSGAGHLRTHMLNSSFSIQASPIYEEAALYAANHAGPEKKVDEFAAWLTLTPDAQDVHSYAFSQLLHELADHPTLVGPSGLILTTKGYIELVRSRVVPLLVTHADPESREYFLRLYEQEGAVFVSKKTLHPAQETVARKKAKANSMLDDLEEYAAVHVNVDTVHTAEHLEHLIADGQYHAALLLRQEFEEWDLPIPPSPVYAFAAQQTIAKLLDLAALKRDTKLDDDLISAAFSSWFSLVPNMSQNTDDLKWLDDIRHYLLTMSRTNIPIIRQFGLICAEKGYSQAIQRHIIPHIVRLSSPDASYQFLEQFMERAKAWDVSHGKSSSPLVTQAMKISLHEYANGGYLDSAMKVLTLCEEDGIKLPLFTYDHFLRKLQTRPNRAAVLAPKVNQAKNRWYPSGQAGTASTRKFPVPDHELARLVDTEQFDLATKLLREYTGPPIPPDHWYTGPAKLALQHPNADERLALFKLWFSLIPDASTSTPKSFDAIKSRFLPISQNTQIPAAFALICAKKGYFTPILHDVVPSIIKKGFPFTTARFLDELVVATKEGTSTYPLLEAKLQLTRVLDVCVRAFCKDRRPAEAVTFLRAQKQHETKPSRQVLDMLIGILGDYYHGYLRHPDILYVRRLRALPTDLVVGTGDLLTDVRYWRNMLSPSSKMITVPHHETIALFIEDYARAGRTKGLISLHNKALRTPRIPIGSAWVFGEMLFHHRQKNYKMIIATYASYFTLVGVPRLWILDFIQNWAKEATLPVVVNPKGRALPSPKHVTLVWDAMIKLAEDRQSLSALYNHFRQQIRISQSAGSELHVLRKRVIGDTKEAPRPPPTLLFEPGIFCYFISAFSHHYSARYGARIIMDMIKMQMAPGAHHLTLVAEAYAKQGEAYPAISLLQLMERSEFYRKEGISPDAVKVDALEMLKASLLASKFSIPKPTLISYLAVMRALLASDKLTAAQEVMKLMYHQLRYKAGTNVEMDRVIETIDTRLTAVGKGGEDSQSNLTS